MSCNSKEDYITSHSTCPKQNILLHRSTLPFDFVSSLGGIVVCSCLNYSKLWQDSFFSTLHFRLVKTCWLRVIVLFKDYGAILKTGFKFFTVVPLAYDLVTFLSLVFEICEKVVMKLISEILPIFKKLLVFLAICFILPTSPPFSFLF